MISDEFGMVKNVQEQYLRDVGYKRHAFNILVSSKIGLTRDIPDTRNKLCAKENYPVKDLPTVSIIICFYNEHVVTLLRSIKSVLDRTPFHLLAEIILVDDFSDSDDLKFKLESEVKTLNADKIHIIRNEKREGLIRSRVFGARQSKGDVLLFLDSHIEANVGYIEPLLSRIKDDRTVLAIPVIDIINPDTFVYTPSPLVRGGFNWGLHFKWDNLPEGTLVKDADFLGPFKSPTMAGGLFAINRLYFSELGEYDLGLVVNISFQFRQFCDILLIFYIYFDRFQHGRLGR